MKSLFTLILLFVSVFCSLTTPIVEAATKTAAGEKKDRYVADVRRFNQWLNDLDPEIKIHIRPDTSSSGLGTGVYTNTTVKKGEAVLKLPLKYVLCDEILTQSKKQVDGGVEYSGVIQRHFKRPDDRIAAAIMTERALRGLSRWLPWIRVLPEVGIGMNLPHLWPQSLRNSIVPLPVRESVNQIARDQIAHFENMKVPMKILQQYVLNTLKKQNIKIPSDVELATDFSLERYQWAHAVVSSRAWNLNGKKYLVPGADMFNHDYDVEDKAYDFKRDTTIGTVRSQKFLMFHTVLNPKSSSGSSSSASDGVDASIGGGGNTNSGKYVEVLSDRRALSQMQLFESYGDSNDKIYFTYLGFVASDIEDLLLAAITGLDSESTTPPHIDLQLFSSAWSVSTTRNRRDCLDIELHEPMELGKKAEKANENTKKEGGGGDDDDEEANSGPPFNSPPKPMVAWAKRLLNVGGMDGRDIATVCAKFGEVHPLHWLFHFLTQLPPEVVLNDVCFQRKVDSMSRHSTQTKLYPAAKVMMRRVRECLNGMYEASHADKSASNNATLRTIAAITNDIAKRILPNTFGITSQSDAQRFEQFLIDDVLEAKIVQCRVNGVRDRDACFRGFPHILSSDFAPASSFGTGGTALPASQGDDKAKALDIATLMNFRLSLQQRMIVLELQRKLEVKRSKALEEREKLQAQKEDGDYFAENQEEGEEGGGGKKVDDSGEVSGDL